jgi:hypothetical protein
MNIAGIDWVPVRSAAKQLQVTRQRIYALCNEGKLVSIKLEGIMLVSAAAVTDRILKLQSKRG